MPSAHEVCDQDPFNILNCQVSSYWRVNLSKPECMCPHVTYVYCICLNYFKLLEEKRIWSAHSIVENKFGFQA